MSSLHLDSLRLRDHIMVRNHGCRRLFHPWPLLRLSGFPEALCSPTYTRPSLHASCPLNLSRPKLPFLMPLIPFPWHLQSSYAHYNVLGVIHRSCAMTRTLRQSILFQPMGCAHYRCCMGAWTRFAQFEEIGRAHV